VLADVLEREETFSLIAFTITPLGTPLQPHTSMASAIATARSAPGARVTQWFWPNIR